MAQTLASGSEDDTIKLWDVATGSLKGYTGRTRELRVNSVAFSPDGKTLASGSWGPRRCGYGMLRANRKRYRKYTLQQSRGD